MKLRDGFVLRNVAGANVVVPIGARSVDFNGMITLNETGAFLWKKLETGADVDSLTAAILSEYDTEEETARTAAAEFLHRLKEAGCLA